MMLVKITILLFVILAIWTLLTRAYYKANPLEAIALSYTLNNTDDNRKSPAWLVVYAILIFAEVAMILASVIWLLFLRKRYENHQAWECAKRKSVSGYL